MSKFTTQREKFSKNHENSQSNERDVDRLSPLVVVNEPISFNRKLQTIELLPRQNYNDNGFSIYQQIEGITIEMIPMFQVQKIEYPFDPTDGFRDHSSFDTAYFWRKINDTLFELHVFATSYSWYNAEIEINLHYLSERYYNEVRHNKK